MVFFALYAYTGFWGMGDMRNYFELFFDSGKNYIKLFCDRKNYEELG